MMLSNRRQWLQAACAAGAACAFSSKIDSGGAAAQVASRRKFTMCLTCGSIGVRADPRKAIDLAHRFGFESIEPAADFLARLSDDQLQELRSELKQKKLAWGAAGLPVDFRSDDDAFQASMQRFPEWCRGLQRAGVTRVGTWISPSHKSLTYVANFRQHARRLREAAKTLADHDQRLGLEYVGPKTSWTATQFPFIHTMAEMKDLLAEIGQPNVGFVLDSWHWFNARETEADLLTLANKDVVSVDLNDAPAGVPIDQQMDLKRELPCATGVIDVKTFLGALVKIGYDGPIRAEPFNKALAAMSAEQAVAATAAAMKKAFALVQ